MVFFRLFCVFFPSPLGPFPFPLTPFSFSLPPFSFLFPPFPSLFPSPLYPISLHSSPFPFPLPYHLPTFLFPFPFRFPPFPFPSPFFIFSSFFFPKANESSYFPPPLKVSLVQLVRKIKLENLYYQKIEANKSIRPNLLYILLLSLLAENQTFNKT